MSEEKKLTGIDEIEAGFTAEPEVSPVEQVEIDSFIAGASELNEDLKAAGIPVPEKAGAEVPVSETAIGIEENVFTDMPELTPIEQIETDSFIAGKDEIDSDMAAAGIEVPAAAEKKTVPVEETAIGMEENAFLQTPDISPLEQLEADEFIASPGEIAEDMKKAGL